MDDNNTSYARTTVELQDNIYSILRRYRKQDFYIVDRNRCINFGSIFRDGTLGYSNIDLFCERIFAPHTIKVMSEDVNYLSQEDTDIIEYLGEAHNYMSEIAEKPESADPDKVSRYKMVIDDLTPIANNITPLTKKVDVPFYVNTLTKERFPVVSLKDAKDEDLKEWADVLARYVEVAKLTITPAAFDSNQQPDGLSVMVVDSGNWCDIVIR